MAENKLCEEIGELLLSQSEGEELPEYAKEHIECCEKCKEQQEKIIKMNSILKNSKPVCPELRKSVLDRINRENIKIAQPKKKHHFPIGVLASAAAIFAVYISVYGTKLPDMIFNMNDTAFEDAVFDEEAVIVPESETQDQFDYASKAMFKKAEMPIAEFSAAAGENMKLLNDVCETADCDGIEADSGAITEAETETEAVKETAQEAVFEEKNDAEILFEKYSQLYPDEISLDDVESAGWDVYEDFVMSVEGGKSNYTLEEFLKFAQ